MRKFAAAATLFAVALGGGYALPAAHATGDRAQQRTPAHRRLPARAVSLGRESLAAVEAAGTGRATVTEVVGGEQVTATSWFAVRATTSGTEVSVPAAASAQNAAVSHLATCLNPRAAAALFTVATDVRRMGPARVGGQVTVRYRLAVDLESLAAQVAPEPIDALRAAGLTSVGLDIWLDQAKRPARVTITASDADDTAVEVVDCRYSDWGTAPELADTAATAV